MNGVTGRGPLSRASRPHHRNGAHQHVPLEVLVVGGAIGQKFFPSISLNLKQASLSRRFVARRKWTTNQKSARRLLATVTALVFGSSEPQITERGFEGLPKIRVFRRVAAR